MFMDRESLAHCLVGVVTPQREQYSEKSIIRLKFQRLEKQERVKWN